MQRFVLGYVRSDRSASAKGAGPTAREIAAVMTGSSSPSRAAVVSIGRAMVKLADAGHLYLYRSSPGAAWQAIDPLVLAVADATDKQFEAAIAACRAGR